MILYRTLTALSKFNRLSSVARSVPATILCSVRLKHNTPGGSNPRSGRRESGNTHHGKTEISDLPEDVETLNDTTGLLDDK